jgi:lysozyme
MTVGIGRNLQAVPFSQDEIELMFSNDLRRARAGAKTFECYVDLDPMRQGVLTEMVFQMGVNGVSKFKKFLIAANNHDWAAAAEEMLDSKWAKQTPERAKSLAKLFLRGVSER